MITRIGDKIISITKVPDLRNYRGDRVLGLSCTSGRFGYIKLLSDLELPEFWDYISGRCDDSLCSIQKRKVMELLGLTKEILGSIITTPARASEFLLRHEISHILHHDSDDIRLSESSHLDPYRIGIEARATWEAWKQMKNKYMAKFRVQRMYADPNNNQDQNGKSSGMGLGTKILAGTALAAGTFAAARRGAFGTNTMRATNELWGRAGQKLGSQGMVSSAREKFVKANVKDLNKTLGENALKGDAFKKEVNEGVQNLMNNTSGKFDWMKDIQQAAFSDTKQDLHEAALIGTGLTTVGTGIYLAKKGKLGKTAKKTYDKAVARVKRYYKETERNGVNNKPKQPEVSTPTTATAAGAGKKPFYSKEDKKAAEKYAKENGLSSWQEAAEKLGFKPESYK